MSSRSRTLLALAYAVGGLAVAVEMTGGSWDIQFHIARQILQDEFWTPPHAVLYGGALAVLLATSGGLLVTRGTPDLARHRLGLLLALGGGLVQVAAGGFDEWWHGVYGVDDVLSPPHVLLLAGMNVAGFGLVLGATRLLRDPAARRSLPFGLYGFLAAGLVLAYMGFYFALWGMAWVLTYPSFVADPFLPQLWQRSVVAAAFAALVPFVTVAAARSTPFRGAATGLLAAAVASGDVVGALMGELPSDPLAIALGAAVFLVPGAVADLSLRRTWGPAPLLAVAAGMGLLGGLILVLFPFGPVLSMTGGLEANPAWFPGLYLAGGVLGALVALPFGRRLRAGAPPPAAELAALRA